MQVLFVVAGGRWVVAEGVLAGQLADKLRQRYDRTFGFGWRFLAATGGLGA